MYSKGVMWLDDCRIPFVDEGDKSFGIENKIEQNIYGGGNGFIRGKYNPDTQGRFTPNLLVCDDMLNDGSITSQSSGLRKNPGIKTDGWNSWHNNIKPIPTQGDKGTNSRYYDLDLWFDKMLERL